MTRILKILIYFNFLFCINLIQAKCKCYIKELNAAENFIHFSNLELCNLSKILSSFDLFLERRKFLIDKWKYQLSEFEQYISGLNCENKIISSSYRFLRWLHIASKKLIGYKSEINKELKEVIHDFEYSRFSQNPAHCKCANFNEQFITEYNNLNNQMNELSSSYINLKNKALSLMEESIQFRSEINNLICSQRFENLCCWY